MVRSSGQRPEPPSSCRPWVFVYSCHHMEGPGRSNGLDLRPSLPRESMLFLRVSVAVVWKKLVFLTDLWQEFT